MNENESAPEIKTTVSGADIVIRFLEESETDIKNSVVSLLTDIFEKRVVEVKE